MNYTGPKVKISRKLGLNLTPKAGKVSTRKPYPPGQHGGNKRRAKQSDYGRQLLEKQRLRLQYNLSEKQMGNFYKEAVSQTGNTADLLVQLIETRLDALVYRAGLAPTIYSARQFVSHGHIMVNGKKVTIPSFKVKVNDVISVKEKSRKIDSVQESIRTVNAPAYLEVSKADFSAKLAYIPHKEEVPIQCELALVVEYYSR
ncbi:MAG: 30S ribosomal protein S4 [Candidatus Kapaibacterium sp.]|jgi:small subunit ribosomal protein S4|nr:30S ribosomal protein S4 [Candidatus Kapabacteria bacterium]